MGSRWSAGSGAQEEEGRRGRGEYLNVSLPCVVGGRDGARRLVVEELGVFPQSSPEAKLLSGIVALVDEVGLVRICVVTIDEGLNGAIPGVLFEGAPLAQAEAHRLAKRSEEGGLVGGRPAEARPSMLAGGMVGGVVAAGGDKVLFGHGEAGGRASQAQIAGGGRGPRAESKKKEDRVAKSIATDRRSERARHDAMPNKLAAGHLGWGDGGLGGHRFVIRARWWIVQKAEGREPLRNLARGARRDGLACLARPGKWTVKSRLTTVKRGVRPPIRPIQSCPGLFASAGQSRYSQNRHSRLAVSSDWTHKIVERPLSALNGIVSAAIRLEFAF